MEGLQQVDKEKDRILKALSRFYFRDLKLFAGSKRRGKGGAPDNQQINRKSSPDKTF